MMSFRNSQGTILIITLWVLTLLSSIVMSLVYRMRIELELVQNEVDNGRVFPVLNAAKIQALTILSQDSGDYNALNGEWSNHTTQMYEFNPFNHIAVGDGTFTVSYVYERDVFTGSEMVFYGMEDEARRINVNKATQDMLESLPGMTPEIAISILAWRGDPELTADVFLKEDIYYKGLDKPYARKGEDVASLEELLLVRGMTKELLFGKDVNKNGVIDSNESGLNSYITVYGDGLININTVGITVMRAIGFTEDLGYAIYRYRKGQDELIGTADDRVFTDVSSIASQVSVIEPLVPDEVNVLQQKQALLKVNARFFTAHLKAEVAGRIEQYVKATFDKEGAKGNQTVAWWEL